MFDDAVGDLTEAKAHALDCWRTRSSMSSSSGVSARDLAESNTRLEQFAAQVSHDLRNPLTALSGFLELAADSPEMIDAPRASRSLARAEAAASRMTSMVTDLLDFARVGGARPTALRQRRRREIVDEVLEDLDGAVVGAGAEVVVDASMLVRADDTLLRVLLQNLIANAVKFTVAAGREPRVFVTVQELPDGWRLLVDDNGDASIRRSETACSSRCSADTTPRSRVWASAWRPASASRTPTAGTSDSTVTRRRDAGVGRTPRGLRCLTRRAGRA